jgi:hypothetical protein
MDTDKRIAMYAKKTFMALRNPYGSVERVFVQAFDVFGTGADRPYRYMGIKDLFQIPHDLVAALEEKGSYRLHTLDRCSDGGRAVDIHLKNPISGKCMTGSSSGTAINVRTCINDLGIGTDGGGSVLAPAVSVNLYGFISKLVCPEAMARHSKVSTDGIRFNPSLGFMTRTMDEMEHAVSCVIDLPGVEARKPRVVFDVGTRMPEALHEEAETREEKFPDLSGNRGDLIAFLQDTLPTCEVLVSFEGPVDAEGFGDSIFGHFDEVTRAIQRSGNKGLIRVANMVDATAIVVPDTRFACATLLLCESVPEKIAALFRLARLFAVPEDTLSKRYFEDTSIYFPKRYMSE